MSRFASALAVMLAYAAPVDAGEPSIREEWRLILTHDRTLSARVGAAVAQADGTTLVAIDFEGMVTVPGHPAVTSRGERDILLVRLDQRGQPSKRVQVGGQGHDEVHGLAIVDGTPYLAMTSTGAISIGGETHRPPPSKMEYVAEHQALLIALDGALRPASCLQVWPGARKMILAAMPSGDLLASTYTYSMADDSEFTAVHRISLAGKRIWSRNLDAPEASAIDPLADRVAVATMGKRRLGVTFLDPATGVDLGAPARIDTHFTGDRGRITGVVSAEGGLRAIGHTGRPAIQAPDGRRLSHPIEPFSLPLGRASAERRSIVDAVASVTAVGLVGGQPAALVHVIHHQALYGGHALPRRGTYLAVGDAPIQFAPLYGVDYAIDDPEDISAPDAYGAKTVVVGQPIVPLGGRFIGAAVLVYGLCGDAERTCIARYAIGR